MKEYGDADQPAPDSPPEHERERAADRGPSRIGRRQYLATVGAAVGTCAIGTLSTSEAAAAPNYTVYELDADETYRRVIESEETFENVLIDATATGADVRIDARGSNWTIRNVGIKGRLDESDAPAFRLRVSDGATGRFENVYLGEGAVDGGHSGVFVPTSHEGTLLVGDCNVQYWPDNGIYASATGRTEKGGRGGLVRIERSYARNNNIAGFRLGSDRSTVWNSVVHVDSEVRANPAGQRNARGVWVKEGGSVVIDGCDVLLEHSDGSHCVREGDDNSVGLARVLDSGVAASDGAGRFGGNVETANVTDDPDVTRPPTVPKSAKEAALGRNLPKTVKFAGGSGADPLEYTFETTGEVAGTRSTEPAGVVSGGRASGTSTGSSAIFHYAGELIGLDASLPDDGSVASIDVDRSAGRIEFAGGDRNDLIEYSFRVTGSVEPTSNVNPHDVRSGDEAKGRIFGGTDTYEYDGDVATLRVGRPNGDPDISIDLRTAD